MPSTCVHLGEFYRLENEPLQTRRAHRLFNSCSRWTRVLPPCPCPRWEGARAPLAHRNSREPRGEPVQGASALVGGTLVITTSSPRVQLRMPPPATESALRHMEAHKHPGPYGWLPPLRQVSPLWRRGSPGFGCFLPNSRFATCKTTWSMNSRGREAQFRTRSAFSLG